MENKLITITAINNKVILKQIKENNNIQLINTDILYKEGILEFLEINKKIDLIILKENIQGNIDTIELIKKIKLINNKIKIVILLSNNNLNLEEKLKNNNVYIIYIKNNNINNIMNFIEKRKNKNRIKKIGIIGSPGIGKTIFTVIISEILINIFHKKVLLIDGDIKLKSLTKLYIQNKKIKEINYIKKELSIINIKEVIRNKEHIINKINKVKNEFDYIIIDVGNIENIKYYKKIINQFILILELNLLEIKKSIKIMKENKNTEIILNNYNKNCLSENSLKKIFNHKKIIEKIENNKNYNLIINNNLNINLLDKKTKNKFINIIKKLKLID